MSTNTEHSAITPATQRMLRVRNFLLWLVPAAVPVGIALALFVHP